MRQSKDKRNLRWRIGWLYAVLIAGNICAWIWAFALFQAQPLMLGTALLAWGLGLRHAVDADHIAAIDNVTRKLMQDGKRPPTVGFWFAMRPKQDDVHATASPLFQQIAVRIKT